MYSMEHNPREFYKIIRNYQEAQLFFSALKMHMFSYLDSPMAAEHISKNLKLDVRKTEMFLLTLVSCGFINKQGEYYFNTPKTKAFLSQQSEVFLGDSLLLREEMTSLKDIEQKLREPLTPRPKMYDFKELAKAAIPEMYAGRVQAFLSKIKILYEDYTQPLRILDLGGGTGILSIEFVKHFPNSHATVFDTSQVTDITKKIVHEHHLESKIDIISGDFNTDQLQGPYDFIIASGILNFVTGDLSDFIKKISDALNEKGYLLVIGQFVDHDHNAPPNMISWLSGCLDGIPLPPSEREMTNAIQKADLQAFGNLNDALFEGKLYQKSKMKTQVFSEDVIHLFIELTEKIANSKTNVLNFGAEDMTFYRGEIHMIKMIGDFPNIHSAKLARKFGITRAVVHKTLQKLSDRELIIKHYDPSDNKRLLLNLTEKGYMAYHFHEHYHNENDKMLFDFLANVSEDHLSAIKMFLEHAIGLIQNHA